MKTTDTLMATLADRLFRFKMLAFGVLDQGMSTVNNRRLLEHSLDELVRATEEVLRDHANKSRVASPQHAPAAEAPKPEASPAEPLVNLVDWMEHFLQTHGELFQRIAHLDHLGVESEGHILEIRKVKGGGK